MISIVKEEELYQNKVNSCLVSTCNCKVDYQLELGDSEGFRWLSGNLTKRHHNTLGKKINVHVWVKEIWVLIMTVTSN